jgi:hypothetical protein
MKQLMLSLTLFAGITFAANAQKVDVAAPKAAVQGPTIGSMAKFTDERIDVGQKPQGTPVTVSFKYKNVSKAPIVLESAQATCGCTVPQKPDKPTMPGKTDEIKATYNAASLGKFEKPITIKFVGSNETKQLIIVGEIVAAPAAAEAPKQ